MLSVGLFELVLIFMVALLVLGPQQLPKAARQIARLIGQFHNASNELKRQVFWMEKDIQNSKKEDDPHG